MAAVTYLQRASQWQCAQWDGTNASDVDAAMVTVGWHFTVDDAGGGLAHTPFDATLPVPIGTWVVAGNGCTQFMDAASFERQFIQGSSWVVAP